jgi:hypothetical protein
VLVRVQGCDASVLIAGPDDEHSAGADTTLSPDALDLITRAKAAVDADAQCANKVSCADILALAARDVVSQVNTPTPSPLSLSACARVPLRVRSLERKLRFRP